MSDNAESSTLSSSVVVGKWERLCSSIVAVASWIYSQLSCRTLLVGSGTFKFAFPNVDYVLLTNIFVSLNSDAAYYHLCGGGNKLL